MKVYETSRCINGLHSVSDKLRQEISACSCNVSISCYLKVFCLFINLVNLLTAFLQYGTSPKHSRVGLHGLGTTGKKGTLGLCDNEVLRWVIKLYPVRLF